MVHIGPLKEEKIKHVNHFNPLIDSDVHRELIKFCRNRKKPTEIHN